jgi:hypothetical protein
MNFRMPDDPCDRSNGADAASVSLPSRARHAGGGCAAPLSRSHRERDELSSEHAPYASLPVVPVDSDGTRASTEPPTGGAASTRAGDTRHGVTCEAPALSPRAQQLLNSITSVARELVAQQAVSQGASLGLAGDESARHTVVFIRVRTTQQPPPNGASDVPAAARASSPPTPQLPDSTHCPGGSFPHHQSGNCPSYVSATSRFGIADATSTACALGISALELAAVLDWAACHVHGQRCVDLRNGPFSFSPSVQLTCLLAHRRTA